MSDKKIPWWSPEMGQEEQRLVKEVLDSNYVNEGKLALEFEQKIADRVGAKYGIVTTSCTIAIFLALKGLGVGKGDEVIVPDMTFIATANAAELTGATPILVDVDPATLNMSPEAFRAAITPRTKAVVPVHVTGRAADLKRIMEIAAEHNILVVEDAAEALMSKHEGKYLGTFGKAGCFSFSPNKTITTGQGGIVVTDDPELNIRIRELKDQGRPQRGSGGNDLHNTIGYNFKFSNLHSAVGLGQLTYLDQRIKRQRRIYEIYRDNLKDVPEITLYPCDLEGGAVPQWTDIATDRRDELEAYLQTKNVDTRKYWYPLHTQLAYKEGDERFPNSTKTSPRSLWLSSAYSLSDEDVLMVCGHIKDFFRTT